MPGVTAPTLPSRGPATGRAMLVVSVLLIAANLRFGVTSAGALLHHLGVSGPVAAVLTALPIICFGLAGLAASPLIARWGREKLLTASLCCTGAGLLLRGLDGTATLIAGTAVAMAGVAIGNVLMPSVVRAWFPDQVARLTGAYSATLVAASAAGSSAAVPLANLLGGPRAGLAVWAPPALLALGLWCAVRRQVPAQDTAPGAARHGIGRTARHSTTRVLTLFFGAQAFTGYVVLEWLPTILAERGGVDPASAGLLVGTAMLLSGVVAVALPRLSARLSDLRPVVVAVSLAMACGFLGLLLAPGQLPVLWAILTGLGMGVFPLGLMLVGLKAQTPDATAALSVVVQSVGYLVAGVLMSLFGALRSAGGGWTWPLVMTLAVVLAQILAGLRAAHHRTLPVDAASGERPAPHPRTRNL
ncbi:MFS transporter [Streptomyces sp. NPDC047123]|uniref:MFS transporter n=1 Tax=Streptomyces sp. NPDC047123 TaxID=3155622 RepID=UPI0033C64027